MTFTALNYDNTATATQGPFTLTVRVERDDSGETPWHAEDGHGPVRMWDSKASKAPGELILSENRHGDACFYDFAEACRIARRDGWGISPYRTDTERGANGLLRVTGQWFDSETRDIISLASDWCDDINEARRQIYAAHRATMSPRAYAAQAARRDYERLRAWCNDDWHYCGVIVTVTHTKTGVELASASLWGIESDWSEGLLETANDLADEAIRYARDTIAAMASA